MSDITPRSEYTGVDRRRQTSLGSIQVPLTWVFVILGAVLVNVVLMTVYFTTQGNQITEIQRKMEEKDKGFKDFGEKQAAAFRDAKAEAANNIERLSQDMRERRNLTEADIVLLRAQLHDVSDHMIKAESRLELLWSQFPGPTPPTSPGGRK